MEKKKAIETFKPAMLKTLTGDGKLTGKSEFHCSNEGME